MGGNLSFEGCGERLDPTDSCATSNCARGSAAAARQRTTASTEVKEDLSSLRLSFQPNCHIAHKTWDASKAEDLVMIRSHYTMCVRRSCELSGHGSKFSQARPTESVPEVDRAGLVLQHGGVALLLQALDDDELVVRLPAALALLALVRPPAIVRVQTCTSDLPLGGGCARDAPEAPVESGSRRAPTMMKAVRDPSIPLKAIECIIAHSGHTRFCELFVASTWSMGCLDEEGEEVNAYSIKPFDARLLDKGGFTPQGRKMLQIFQGDFATAPSKLPSNGALAQALLACLAYILRSRPDMAEVLLGQQGLLYHFRSVRRYVRRFLTARQFTNPVALPGELLDVSQWPKDKCPFPVELASPQALTHLSEITQILEQAVWSSPFDGTSTAQVHGIVAEFLDTFECYPLYEPKPASTMPFLTKRDIGILLNQRDERQAKLESLESLMPDLRAAQHRHGLSTAEEELFIEYAAPAKHPDRFAQKDLQQFEQLLTNFSRKEPRATGSPQTARDARPSAVPRTNAVGASTHRARSVARMRAGDIPEHRQANVTATAVA